MTLEIPRRRLLGAFVAALAMPAIIRTPGLLMPIRVARPSSTIRWYTNVSAIRNLNILLAPGIYAGEPVVVFRGIPILLAGPVF